MCVCVWRQHRWCSSADVVGNEGAHLCVGLHPCMELRHVQPGGAWSSVQHARSRANARASSSSSAIDCLPAVSQASSRVLSSHYVRQAWPAPLRVAGGLTALVCVRRATCSL